jgi:hypothetical protein
MLQKSLKKDRELNSAINYYKRASSAALTRTKTTGRLFFFSISDDTQHGAEQRTKNKKI